MGMRLTKRLVGLGTGAAAAACLLGSASAQAVFPNFSDCPRGTAIIACIDIQSRTGSMTIKSTTVPLGESLMIRGALRELGPGQTEFVPPSGTNGFFARPVQVPGGLLGIDFPIPGNAVTATAELAGPASALRINPGDFSINLPMKLKLENPILGPWCHIGSNSNPANVNLIIGTTNPPPPNRPISGAFGSSRIDGNVLTVNGIKNVDNAFSIPGASSCGIGLGLVNGVINLKLGLPSSAGNNTLIVQSDLALQIL